MAALSLHDHTSFGVDTTFESYIDADLMLDAGSPAPGTPSRDAGNKQASRLASKVAPLSSLPTRLNLDFDRHTHPSPSPGFNANVSDFLAYHDTSPVPTTPTTSNSSSLHALNFDFLNSADSSCSAPGSTTATTLSPHDDLSMGNYERAFVSSGAAEQSRAAFAGLQGMPMSSFTEPAAMPSLADFSFASNAMAGNVMTGKPMAPVPTHAPLFGRAVDDMGLQPGHQHVIHHPQNIGQHGRSLSLRDVVPFLNQGAMPSMGTQAMGMMAQANAKMQQQTLTHIDNLHIKDDILSPLTNDQGSPASTTFSFVDPESPQQGKRRRLSSSVKADGTKTRKSSSASSKANARTSAGSETLDADQKKSIKSGLKAKKGGKQGDNNDMCAPAGISAASLIENVPQARLTGSDFDDTAMPPIPMQHFATPAARPGMSNSFSHSSMASSDFHGSGEESDWMHEALDKTNKKGNKRPPPSASQITESGMPFPVIDTSAKHSSLFVPPDTSGLTKREARLVKNRAAAFLSRQRKREQFEELEIKCKSLCQLVWKMWQVGVAGDDPANPSTQFHNLVAQDETADVREILETVLQLEGGSIAPTEDGQLQGAVAAGIKSANGKICASEDGKQFSLLAAPSCAAKAAHEAARELATLRAEMAESKTREALLQSQIDGSSGLPSQQGGLQSAYRLEARHLTDALDMPWSSCTAAESALEAQDEAAAETTGKASKPKARIGRAARTRSASRASAAAAAGSAAIKSET